MDQPLSMKGFMFPKDTHPIRTVEMHTTGEPTRIIYSGFPVLQGARLLNKMVDAKTHHDHIRRRLMHEPRGHSEMYGALLVKETELTATGEANIGVLFMHNEGWSTMCGHAMIALGRFLVDIEESHYLNLCGGSYTTDFRPRDSTVLLMVHVPCGLIELTVPVKQDPSESYISDPERPVSFINVPSYATGMNIQVPLPLSHRWPELQERTEVTVDFCYGGAFYCVVDAKELGFHDGLRKENIDALSRATGVLKAVLVTYLQYREYFRHTEEPELSFLYGVIVTDSPDGNTVTDNNPNREELGVCFFAAQQLDRSPTGSGVAGRRALAHAKGIVAPEQRLTYHSLLSVANDGLGSFAAHVVDELRSTTDSDPRVRKVRVQVEGRAFYTGFATFLVEEGDTISKSGFQL